MTVLLKKAFEEASMLPEVLQDEIAKEVLADIHERRDKRIQDKNSDRKLSWEETYKEIAEEKEGWEIFDITLLDGLSGDEFDSQKI